MNNYKDFFECKIIDGDDPHSKQMQIKQIKPFDFSQAQLENPILNAAIETLDKQIYKKIGIECDAMILKDALRKAKIYDNLSNELGYPLELYFKLKSGTEILDKSNNVWFLESITNHKSLNCYREKEVYNYMGIGKLETIYHNFKIKNYSKTWWLKGEK